MSFPGGPSSARMPAVRARYGGPVLAVGHRVLVTGASQPPGRVTLTDDNGDMALATLADGVEVEILAWKPRGSAGTRYRVKCTADRTEGWLSGTSLRPLPPTKPPVRLVVAPVAAARTPETRGARPAASKAPATRVARKKTKARK